MPHAYVKYQRRLKPRARQLRRDQTPAERKLWYEFLRGLPHKITRQKPLDSYIADFYCAQRLLVIELDGDSHYSGDGTAYDAMRTATLQSKGIRVLRFTNTEVMREFEGVCLKIAAALNE